LENVNTIKGSFLHEKTEDPFAGETSGDLIILRAAPLISHNLGLIRRADLVELHRTYRRTPVLVYGLKQWIRQG